MNELLKELATWWPHPVRQIAADTWIVTLATPDVEMIEICTATPDTRNADHLQNELVRKLVADGWDCDRRQYKDGEAGFMAFRSADEIKNAEAPTPLEAVLRVANEVYRR
jgi:hypothetical protein